MSDQVTVKVLLKVESYFTANPYEEGDMLHPVLTFTTGFPACGHVELLLRIVFEQLNIDEPRADWGIEYRSQHNRNLSVGDVVVVGESAWAVERVGWKPVHVEDYQIWHDGEPRYIVADDAIPRDGDPMFLLTGEPIAD